LNPTPATEARRRNMQAVRNKDTKIELALRKALWKRGIRYRKHKRDINGKPDIVFVGKKVAVFCDSEFWHGKDWEIRKLDFKSHQSFWIPKIERNIQRDIEVNRALEAAGWLVLRFWGKDILKNTEGVADRVVNALKDR
jgi:DNA mismatch endonuclease, patch repair protein